MAIPLGFSRKQIATEAVSATQIRSYFSDKFGTGARVTQLDQVLLEAGAGAIDAQREELRQAGNAASAETTHIAELSDLVALAAGIDPEAVTIDRDHHRATASATPLSGTTLHTYHALERRMPGNAEGWEIALVPPQEPFPPIVFTDGSDMLNRGARDAVLTGAWAATRWNMRNALLAATYLVVLFSVIVQGGSIERVLARMSARRLPS